MKAQITVVTLKGHELVKFDQNNKEDVKKIAGAIMEKIVRSSTMYGIPKGKSDGEFEKVIDISGLTDPKNPSEAEKMLIQSKVEELTRILVEEPTPGKQTTFYEPTSYKLVAPHSRG